MTGYGGVIFTWAKAWPDGSVKRGEDAVCNECLKDSDVYEAYKDDEGRQADIHDADVQRSDVVGKYALLKCCVCGRDIIREILCVYPGCC